MNAPTINAIPSAPPVFSGGLKLAACATLSLLITLLAASVINDAVVSSYAPQPAVMAHAATPLPSTVVAAR